MRQLRSVSARIGRLCVSTNGQRFLMVKDSAAAERVIPISMIVVEHWLEQLKTHEQAR